MNRKPPRRLPPPVRDALAAELRALRAAYGGGLPMELVAEFARDYDLSVRTVWRLSGDLDGKPTRQAKFVATDRHLALVARGPSYHKAWEAAVAEGICGVGYEQFTRALRAVDPAVLAGVRYGATAMAARQAYALREAAQRNDVWVIDHYEVPVFVRWPRFRRPLKPWQTTLLDDRHRAVMGAVWWPKAPTAAEAIAAVAAAVRGFTLPDGGFVGGSPRLLLMDQGSELIGEEATTAYLSMRIDPQPAAARAPWVKGKLEAFHQDTLNAGFAAFPGWTGGPVDSAGRQVLTTPDSELLDRDTFRECAWALLARYNVTDEHGALGGDTPLDSWLADPAPLRRLDDALLRPHWLVEHRVVSGKGVQLHSLHYQHPLLGGEGGRTLETRYVPDDRTFLDVRLSSGAWVTALPQPLPATMTSELLRVRGEQGRRVRRVLKSAKQLMAEAHADARAAAPPEPVSTADPPTADGGRAPVAGSAPAGTPARRPRRSTNTRGGGPTAQQTSAPLAPAPPAHRPVRFPPLRFSSAEQEGTP